VTLTNSNELGKLELINEPNYQSLPWPCQ